MRGTELLFALHRDGRMVPIREVVSGLACNCVCPECGRRLVAKKGDYLAHHFAHEAGADCARAYETMLHRLGKQMVLDAGGVKVPALIVRYLGRKRVIYPERWIFFDHVEKEARWPGFQPDVVARRSGREIAVEIKVAHACGPEKIEIVRASGLAMIEIDLSHLSRTASEDQIRKAVLNKAPRSWLFNPRQAEHEAAFIEEVLETVAREREAEFYVTEFNGMRERHAAATKAALAMTKQPRRFSDFDYRLDPEQAPDERYTDAIMDGVTISSRCSKIAEVTLMEQVFQRLSTPGRWLIDTFWCDSKAGSCYSVWMRPGYDNADTTAALGREIHEQLMALSNGHNGIFVGDTTEIGPDWGEMDGL